MNKINNKTKLLLLLICLFLIVPFLVSQDNSEKYVDSVLKTLTDEQKVAQLLIITAYSKNDSLHYSEIKEFIQRFGIGALIFFQGSPTRQAELTNYYQSISKLPLLIFMDAEYGVGMRLDSVQSLPYQIMLGAMNNKKLVYEYGKIVANQCKRLGIHFNLAPVVDVNTNPNNPVINFRSFGENVEKVSDFSVQYIKGLQDYGINACAKHFPGHGDVDVDSHEDLPVLRKKIEELSQVELVPFLKSIQDADVKSILIAHLSLPKIVNERKVPSSISSVIINDLLKESMQFKGLCITDALNMKGLKRFVEDDEIGFKTLIAGNDMLCMPDNIQFIINFISEQMQKNVEIRKLILSKVKKVLTIKYEMMMSNSFQPIPLQNLTKDLNKWTQTNFMEKIASNSQTIVQLQDKKIFSRKYSKIVYIAIGEEEPNRLSFLLGKDNNLETIFFALNNDKKDVKSLYQQFKNSPNTLYVMGIHNYSNSIKNNFGISNQVSNLLSKFSEFTNNVVVFFGNPYAIKDFTNIPNLIVAYNNSFESQQLVAKTILNEFFPQGHLPVSINKNIKANQGISSFDLTFQTPSTIEKRDIINDSAWSEISRLINNNIFEKTFPGCQLFVAKGNKILCNQSFGKTTYESTGSDITNESIYDIASLTKVFATTFAVIKLIEQKKIKLNDKLGKYFQILKTRKDKQKANITIKELLTHTSGFISWIPFYQKTIQKKDGTPINTIYNNKKQYPFVIPVTEKLFLHYAWKDSILNLIFNSTVDKEKKYVYSDLGFILLAQIIEQVTEMPLDEYVQQEFYEPLGLFSTMFNPLNKISSYNIVPTERETIFRNSLLKGNVHDYAAAMLGGVSGNAGLFSNASDLAILSYVLLNNGKLGNINVLSPKIIKQFSQYQSKYNRRGLGFDKPDLANKKSPVSYPSHYSSEKTFGHTGFTGTCFWIDPEKELIYIFLSNRIHPSAENKKIQTNKVREKILDIIYENLLN